MIACAKSCVVDLALLNLANISIQTDKKSNHDMCCIILKQPKSIKISFLNMLGYSLLTFLGNFVNRRFTSSFKIYDTLLQKDNSTVTTNLILVGRKRGRGVVGKSLVYLGGSTMVVVDVPRNIFEFSTSRTALVKCFFVRNLKHHSRTP